jgi:hypothetical protein
MSNRGIARVVWRVFACGTFAVVLAFVLGFVAEGWDGSDDRIAWVLGIVILPAAVFLGCRQRSRGAAPLVGGASMFVALVAGSIGAYTAAQLGWNGLQARDFGSDDIAPRWMLSLYVVILGIPAFLLGAVLGYASRFLGSGETSSSLQV